MNLLYQLGDLLVIFKILKNITTTIAYLVFWQSFAIVAMARNL